jgi:hypothetical protein
LLRSRHLHYIAIAAEMLLWPRPKKKQPLVTLQKFVLKYTGFALANFSTSIILDQKRHHISVSNCKKKIYTLFQIAKCGQTS